MMHVISKILRSFYIIFLLLFINVPLCIGASSTQKGSLNQTHTIGKFKLRFALKGEHALSEKNKADLNNNLIPDYIENIGFRFQATYELLTDVFGFQDPLLSSRYSRKAKFFHVKILDIDQRGISFDELSRRRKSLDIHISNNLNQRSMTPTHELFHTFQNGYSMFKNRWYTEGTARWSEQILKKHNGATEALPTTTRQIEQLLQQTYKTSTLWNRLTFLCDDNNGIFDFNINKYKAVGSDASIIEDNRIYGFSFMRLFLENLGIADAAFSKNLGIEEHKWDESAQKSASNNLPILCALKRTILSKCAANQEIDEFLLALDTFTNKKCI